MTLLLLFLLVLIFGGAGVDAQLIAPGGDIFFDGTCCVDIYDLVGIDPGLMEPVNNGSTVAGAVIDSIDNVVSTAVLMVILIDLVVRGFDGGIDGDID